MGSVAAAPRGSSCPTPSLAGVWSLLPSPGGSGEPDPVGFHHPSPSPAGIHSPFSSPGLLCFLWCPLSGTVGVRAFRHCDLPGQDNPPALSPRGGLTQAEGKHPVAQGVATLEEKISCCWPDVRGRVEEAGAEQSQETDRQTDRAWDWGLGLIPPVSRAQEAPGVQGAAPIPVFPSLPTQCLCPGAALCPPPSAPQNPPSSALTHSEHP